jgi:hypothetical protein
MNKQLSTYIDFVDQASAEARIARPTTDQLQAITNLVTASFLVSQIAQHSGDVDAMRGIYAAATRNIDILEVALRAGRMMLADANAFIELCESTIAEKRRWDAEELRRITAQDDQETPSVGEDGGGEPNQSRRRRK